MICGVVVSDRHTCVKTRTRRGNRLVIDEISPLRSSIPEPRVNKRKHQCRREMVKVYEARFTGCSRER